MRLYNSYSQQLEQFQPQDEDAPVSIYVCGITPYDTTHLGHAFTYTVADILIRYLEYQGRRVRYVQNVTDIDDDILRQADEEGEDWHALGNRWTRHFIQDMQTLNVRPPEFFPRATTVIPQIIEMVQGLLEAGVAYTAAGNVYFQISRWPDFGQLSHLPRVEMLPVANERGNDPDDPHKRDPLDFVLWQAQHPGEPAWSSPWGMGRPGWHIECSTMATHWLGKTIDIHMGGADLLFPHHECEIAQVTPVTHQPFARYWLHTAMVRQAGEKMSKSLGNLVMVRDLLQHYSPNALRLYLGQHHYRQPWSYAEDELAQAGQLAGQIEQAVNHVDNERMADEHTPLEIGVLERAFVAALDEDLQTPQALEVIGALTEKILQAADDGRSVTQAQQTLRTCCQVFGLYFTDTPPSATGWMRHLKDFAE
ncbi:MAG: cysteine--tRNA ligase [Caldilineaceae bacterium]